MRKLLILLLLLLVSPTVAHAQAVTSAPIGACVLNLISRSAASAMGLDPTLAMAKGYTVMNDSDMAPGMTRTVYLQTLAGTVVSYSLTGVGVSILPSSVIAPAGLGWANAVPFTITFNASMLNRPVDVNRFPNSFIRAVSVTAEPTFSAPGPGPYACAPTSCWMSVDSANIVPIYFPGTLKTALIQVSTGTGALTAIIYKYTASGSHVGNLARLMQWLGAVAYRLGLDPPDPNYTVFEPFVKPNPALFVVGGGLTADHVAKLNKWQDHVASLAGYMMQMSRSLDKADGAWLANDPAWAKAQVAKAQEALAIARAFKAQELLDRQAIYNTADFPQTAIAPGSLSLAEARDLNNGMRTLMGTGYRDEQFMQAATYYVTQPVPSGIMFPRDVVSPAAVALEKQRWAPLFSVQLCGGHDPDGCTEKNRTAGMKLYPITPCRAVDTRFTGGAIAANGTRSFNVRGTLPSQGGASTCGIPSTAKAIWANFVAVTPAGAGFLTAYPAGAGQPNASSLDFNNATIANQVLIPICQGSCGADLTVLAGQAGTNVIIDVLGYEQ